MTDPRVSVLLVTCDQEGSLERALASIESQVIDDVVEVVVADDSSTDATSALVAAWAERVDAHVRVLPRGERLGAPLNLHRGFAACRGRYVAVLEGTDEWLSADMLRRQARLLDDRPDLSAVVTRTLVVEETAGRPDAVPECTADGPLVELTAGQLADGGWIAASGGGLYRAEALERLNPGIFETPDVDWLIDLAMTEHGMVGLLPELTTLHRGSGRPDDLRSRLPEHLHLLGPQAIQRLGGDAGAPERRRGTMRQQPPRPPPARSPRTDGGSSSSTTTSPPRGPVSGSPSTSGCCGTVSSPRC